MPEGSARTGKVISYRLRSLGVAVVILRKYVRKEKESEHKKKDSKLNQYDGP